MTEKRSYSHKEEIMNSVSHGVGCLLAVAGTTVMITLSAWYGSTLAVCSSILYGVTLIVMFAFSTLYHAIPFPRAKCFLQILDHDSIYLLIAGTYTPITLILLRGTSKGVILFWALWGLALLGIILNAVNMNRFRRISLVLYLGMGWAVLFDIPTILARLGSGFALLLAGGICYTVGVVFYKMKKVPYMHGIWHLFVLAGGILHYLCILLYVLPQA